MIKINDIKDEVYEYFYDKIKNGYLFACSTGYHAYSLISIRKENNEKIFKVRNPWNCEKYNDGTLDLLFLIKHNMKKNLEELLFVLYYLMLRHFIMN